jgi:hypothetical protein
LAAAPEEAGHGVVEAADQRAVGHEAAQSGPGAQWPADRERGGGFDAVDAGRNVQFLGDHVVRRHQVGIGRRAEEHAALGLEIEAFVDVGDAGPGAAIEAFGRREGDGAAPTRLQAERRNTGERSDDVGPCAGGVDEQWRAELLRGCRDRPLAVAARDGLHVGVDDELRPMPSCAVQEVLVQAIDIDVAGILVEQGERRRFAAQHRHAGLRRDRVEQLHLRAFTAQLRMQGVQRFAAIGAGGEQRATRRDEGRLTVRPGFEKAAAGTRQRAHLSRAVALHEHRRRAPGGVHARHRLALEHGHTNLRREEER